MRIKRGDTGAGINPEEFRPRVNGESDFYSWQLYRWLKSGRFARVYRGTWNSGTGHDPERPTLYIGIKDPDNPMWFTGRQLAHLCTRDSDLDSGAYGGGHYVQEWEDVTEWFWNEYRRIGVCAIHGDFAHKWDKIYPTKRVCLYCGKVETKRTRYKKVEEWVG
jgi:hypothetical protein